MEVDKYVIYYDDDRIDQYLKKFIHRLTPIVKKATNEEIYLLLKDINEVRGFHSMLPDSMQSSQRGSLELGCDEYNSLKNIKNSCFNLYKILSNHNSAIADKINDAISEAQSAKKYPLKSLRNPEKYRPDNFDNKEDIKQLKLEVDLDEELKNVSRVASLDETLEMLLSLGIATNHSIKKRLKPKGRPKKKPDAYLISAISKLDESFKIYFPKLTGRTNGTPFQNIAFEIFKDPFFGAETKRTDKKSYKN